MDVFPLEIILLIAEQWVPLLFCRKQWCDRMKKDRVDWRYQHAVNIGYSVEIKNSIKGSKSVK
jgi:hypothetical protein